METKKEETPDPRKDLDSTPIGGSIGLLPKELNFATPSTQSSSHSRRSSKSVFDTPTSVPETPETTQNMSDIESLSSEATSLTLDMSSMNIGKKRRRPRKQVEVPKIDDFPVHGSAEEKRKYICKKTTELWRFNKLSSDQSSEYRKAENARVKAYNKKQKTIKSDQSQSDSDHKKKLSRER